MRFGLGRGLNSLIPSKNHFPKDVSQAIEKHLELSDNNFTEKVLNIPTAKIQSNPKQPRQNFDVKNLEELVGSIHEYGIIQPLIVTKTESGDYELIAGERRLRAARALNLKTVPAIIRKAREQEKLEIALIENIQREDLNALEKAYAFQKLADEFSLTQEQIARKLGMSRAAVSNTLRLQNLPDEIKRALLGNKIDEGHARAILGLSGEREQLRFFKKILNSNLSVRDIEGRVKKVKIKQGKIKADPLISSREEALRDYLGTKVEIKKRAGQGKILIHFFSNEEFSGVVKKILKK
jgi:ParB family chromosome partitioning protein